MQKHFPSFNNWHNWVNKWLLLKTRKCKKAEVKKRFNFCCRGLPMIHCIWSIFFLLLRPGIEAVLPFRNALIKLAVMPVPRTVLGHELKCRHGSRIGDISNQDNSCQENNEHSKDPHDTPLKKLSKK